MIVSKEINSNLNFVTLNDVIPITSIDFNFNGKIMGYSTSYNWNRGNRYYVKNKYKTQIYLHCINGKIGREQFCASSKYGAFDCFLSL